jgi:ABC-type sugar transport system permease subunit
MKPAQRISADTWLIIAFLFPTLAFLIFLIWLPFIQGVWMSFHYWPMIGEPKWEGLENYRDFLAADYFWVVIKATIVYSFSTALQLGMALVAALALNQKFIPLKQVWRGIMLMPYAMPPVVTGAIWLYLLDPNMGMVMHYLQKFGIISQPIYWASDSTWAKVVITLVASWTFWPFMFLIILAQLQAVPERYYELAEVYGANLWQRFRTVTLPHIKGAMLTAVIIRIVWNLAKIDQPFQLTGGGPGYETSVLSILTYRFAYLSGDFGMAFTVGIFLVLFTFILIGPFLKKFQAQITKARR